MTQDLHELAEWLRQFGVTQVAMESSGVYWKPVSAGAATCLSTSRSVSTMEVGQALDAVPGTRRLDFGLVALCFSRHWIETSHGRQRDWSVVALRFVSADPFA
jgi:hypothetical protein